MIGKLTHLLTLEISLLNVKKEEIKCELYQPNVDYYLLNINYFIILVTSNQQYYRKNLMLFSYSHKEIIKSE